MDKREVAVYAAVVAVFAILVVLLVTWVASMKSERQNACEDRGGYLYSRTVGKVTKEKCVTDDDLVIQL